MASTLLNGNGGTTANATANSTNETNDMKIGSSNEQHGGAAHTSLQMGQLDSNGGTTVILSRLKELENINQNLAKNLEEAKSELNGKDEKIKMLSADKRKDMEQMIETAIDTWLNSLTGISDEVRKQFRAGVSRIAEHADMKNSAWEVVCQASELHKSNVNRIEELIQQCNQQTKTIESLVGSNNTSAAMDPTFNSSASRMSTGGSLSGPNGGLSTAASISDPYSSDRFNKRQRTDGNMTAISQSQTANVSSSSSGDGGDAWDLFDSMLRDHSKSVYY